MKRSKPAVFLMGVLALALGPAAAQPAGRQLVPALDAATIGARCETELKSWPSKSRERLSLSGSPSRRSASIP